MPVFWILQVSCRFGTHWQLTIQLFIHEDVLTGGGLSM